MGSGFEVYDREPRVAVFGHIGGIPAILDIAVRVRRTIAWSSMIKIFIGVIRSRIILYRK